MIVSDAGGPSKLKERLGLEVSIHTVRSWVARNSIPAPLWQALVDHRLATLEELAACAAARFDRKDAA